MQDPNTYWELFRQAKNGAVVIPEDLTNDKRESYLELVEENLRPLLVLKAALVNRERCEPDKQKIEPSYFQIPKEALSIVRKMLDPNCHEPYYILRPQFMDSIPGGKQCFLGIDYEAKVRQIPAADVLNEKDYLTVFDPGDDLVAVISAEDVLQKEDFAQMMENCGMDATEENLNRVWTVFPNNIPSGSSLKALALTAIHSSMAKEPLEFVFEEEIEVSDDHSKLVGNLCTMPALVERLKAQEPPLEEDQFMEHINFYPVYDFYTDRVSLEGHYFLEDAHYARGKPFALPLTPDESNRLKAAFEAHCMKKKGRSCRAFLRDMKCEQNPERRALVEQIQQAEASATSSCPGDAALKDMPLQTR